MRRTDEEFKEEILKRSHKYIEKRKRVQRNVMFAGASVAVFVIALISFKPGLLMQYKEAAKQTLHDEVNETVKNYEDIEIREETCIQETTPETLKEYIDITEAASETDGMKTDTQDCCILLLDYKAEYTRVDGSGDLFTAKTETQTNGSDKGFPLVKADTIEELNAFAKGVNSYEYVWDSFNDIVTKYNEEFFVENTLLLIYVSEGSGSVRHKVTSVTSKAGKVSVDIERIVPEAGTCDMAGWIITVELKKNDIVKCSEFVAH